jgi:hypothetical protein
MSNVHEIIEENDTLLYKKACSEGDYKKLIAIICKYDKLDIIKQLLVECEHINLDEIFTQAGHYGSIKIFTYFLDLIEISYQRIESFFCHAIQLNNVEFIEYLLSSPKIILSEKFIVAMIHLSKGLYKRPKILSLLENKLNSK